MGNYYRASFTCPTSKSTSFYLYDNTKYARMSIEGTVYFGFTPKYLYLMRTGAQSIYASSVPASTNTGITVGLAANGGDYCNYRLKSPAFISSTGFCLPSHAQTGSNVGDVFDLIAVG